MSRILRHQIPVDDAEHQVPGRLLHVATRHEDVIEAWIVEDDTAPATTVYRVAGTGQEIPEPHWDGLCWTNWEHAGTVITPSEQLVWHLLRRVTS